MNPFDPKAIILAKHAQHVVLIHFPIALFLVGVGLDLVSRGRRETPLAQAAYINLGLAAITAVPAAVTGLVAWQLVLEGKSPKGILLWHLVAALLVVLLLTASWWIHWRARRQQAQLPNYRVAVELSGVLAVVLAAHLGGFLSGVNM